MPFLRFLLLAQTLTLHIGQSGFVFHFSCSFSLLVQVLHLCQLLIMMITLIIYFLNMFRKLTETNMNYHLSYLILVVHISNLFFFIFSFIHFYIYNYTLPLQTLTLRTAVLHSEAHCSVIIVLKKKTCKKMHTVDKTSDTHSWLLICNIVICFTGGMHAIRTDKLITSKT